ncbi:MAG: MarR family transcriptional regulator [Myxococcota bacterium]
MLAEKLGELALSDVERVAGGLHIASRLISAATARAVRGQEISAAEATFILKLKQGLGSPSQIATCLGLDPSNVSRMMRNLEARGLVRRSMVEENRARISVTLTDAGEAAASQVAPAIRHAESAVLAALDEDEIKQMRRWLERVCLGVERE